MSRLIESQLAQSPVHASHRVVDGSLEPQGFVMSHVTLVPQVVTEFAKIRDGDEEALLKFTRIWGAFGLEVISAPADDELKAKPGVPVRWIWGHSGNVRLVLELSEYLRQGDQAGLGKFIEGLQGPEWSRPQRSPVLSIMAIDGPHLTEISGIDPFEKAERLIAEILNANLRPGRDGVWNRLERGPLRVVQSQQPLFAAIYWHLADAISEERPIARCKACNSMFFGSEPAKFCPPLPARLESPCALRFRKQQQRKKTGGQIQSQFGPANRVAQEGLGKNE